MYQKAVQVELPFDAFICHTQHTAKRGRSPANFEKKFIDSDEKLWYNMIK